MRNFLGHDGFIWWIGIVEDINDPLTLGRCRVRCFGYHPSKVSGQIPTEDLPWALAIHPVNTPNLYASPKKGDWVFGFFLDALSAQEPAIIGYLPAVPEEASEYFGEPPSLVRNFDRVHTANNSSNTICWEYGNTIIEIVKESATEANGHLLVQHSTGAKINIDTNGNISLYTSNSNISMTTDTGDIELNGKNVKVNATENFSVVSGQTSTITAGGLVSLTAGGILSLTAVGAITTTAGAYTSITSFGNITAKTIAGILNIESANSLNIISSADLNITSMEELNVTSETSATLSGTTTTISDSQESWTPTSIKADQDRQDGDISIANTLPSDGFAKGVTASIIFGS